jgi:ELWxxDGT repeat protein
MAITSFKRLQKFVLQKIYYTLILLFPFALNAQNGLIAEVVPGSQDGISPFAYASVSVNGFMFFTTASINGNYELWRTDGKGTTQKISSRIAPPEALVRNGLEASGKYIYFFEYIGNNSKPQLVAMNMALSRTILSTLTSNNQDFALLSNGKLIYERDFQLWSFDENSGSQTLLLNFYPYRFFAQGGKAIFTGMLNYVSGTSSVWTAISDGTNGGTFLIKNSIAQNIGGDGLRFYFTADGSGANSAFLYVNNGTDGNAAIVADFQGEARYFTGVFGNLYFIGKNILNNIGWELYKVERNTVINVRDINPGTGNGAIISVNYKNEKYSLEKPIEFDGKIYFKGYSGTGDYDLWSSDGSIQGTNRVRGSTTFPSSKNPEYFMKARGLLYFTAGDITGYTNATLWKTDGSANGTAPVGYTQAYAMYGKTPLLDNLVFPARNAATGIELYRYALPALPGPTLSKFEPTKAQSGDTVVLTGTNFIEVSAVKFGNVPAAYFEVLSKTMLKGVLGSGATGAIEIETPGGKISRNGFTFLNPPVINIFSPASAANGATVTISGKYFTGTTSVQFGGVNALAFTVVNDSTLQAVLGSGGSGSIKVNNKDGEANKTGFTYIAAAPAIQTISPLTGVEGTVVNITGTNFVAVPSLNLVRFGAARATVTAATSTSLSVIVPKGTTYEPITITANQLTTFSNRPFILKFAQGTSGLTSFSFQRTLDSLNSPLINGSSSSVAAADLDGDGKTDMIMADYNTHKISFFRNTGLLDTIVFTPKIDSSTGTNPNAIAVGDLDGDGRPDICISNYSSSNISIFRNISVPGTIAFAPKINITTNANPTDIAIADLNSDGKPDIVSTALNSTTISVFRNTGSASAINFATKTDFYNGISGGTQRNLEVADLNGDGKPEVLVCILGLANSGVSVFRNTSTGASAITFANGQVISNSLSAMDIASGDIDGDGLLDIVTANYNNNNVSVYRNTTSSLTGFSFASRMDILAGTQPQQIKLADMDGDGKPDILTVYNNGAIFSLFKNKSLAGNVSIDNKIDYTTGGATRAITAANLDNDDKPDLIFANQTYQTTMMVLRNRVNEPFISDFAPVNIIQGQTVTINGHNFNTIQSVQFGSKPVTSFSVTGTTKITAIAGNGNSGNITVTNANGKGNLMGLTFAKPEIISFSPEFGAPGTIVTITGKFFSPTPSENKVCFGAVNALVTSATSTSLKVKVPIGSSFTPITVSVNHQWASSRNPFTITFPDGGFIENTSLDGSFTLSTITAVNHPLIADFDGDSIPDLATSDINNSAILFFRNASVKENFIFSPAYSLAVLEKPLYTLSADLNGDGKPELIISHRAPVNKVTVWRNESTPGKLKFMKVSEMIADLEPSQIVVNDLDLDGKPEIVLITEIQGYLLYYPNITVGDDIQFGAKKEINITGAGRQSNFTLADFDGDGRPDLVTSKLSPTSIQISLNTSKFGTISFAHPLVIPVGGNSSLNFYFPPLATGDFDGDGKLDIAAANRELNFVSILRNTSEPGSISFAPKTDISTGQPNTHIARHLAISDMDGDNKPDIIVGYGGNDQANALLVLIKNNAQPGTIAFLPAVRFGKATSSNGIAVNDLDMDGKPEIAVETTNSRNIVIFRNTIGYPIDVCPGGNILFSSNVEGSSYQWQVNTGNNYTNIQTNQYYSGVNTKSLTITNFPTSWSNYKFRCVVNGNTFSHTFGARAVMRWTGLASNAWENLGNWNCNIKLPDAHTMVIINSGNVILNSNTVIKGLTVKPGVTVTTAPNIKLEIKGN